MSFIVLEFLIVVDSIGLFSEFVEFQNIAQQILGSHVNEEITHGIQNHPD
jgi:hypothetical protein